MHDRRIVRSRPRRAALVLVCAAATLVNGCRSVSTPELDTLTPPALDVPASLLELETDVAARVNDFRHTQGLEALVQDSYLTRLAREHSSAMAMGRRTFGHDGFDARADRIHEELEARAVSENIAYNNHRPEDAAASVVDGWLRSDGHRRNITSAVDRAGTGAAISIDGRWYVTQIYAAVGR